MVSWPNSCHDGTLTGPCGYSFSTALPRHERDRGKATPPAQSCAKRIRMHYPGSQASASKAEHTTLCRPDQLFLFGHPEIQWQTEKMRSYPTLTAALLLENCCPTSLGGIAAELGLPNNRSEDVPCRSLKAARGRMILVKEVVVAAS